MRMLKTFNQYRNLQPLNEEISPSSILNTVKPITAYLKKKTGIDFFAYPVIEKFQNAKGKGYGLRLYKAKGPGVSKSIRFNFQTSSPNLVSVQTITYWRGNEGSSVAYNIDFGKQVSFVRILPALVKLIKSTNKPSDIYTMPEDIKMADVLKEAIQLNEGRKKGTQLDNPEKFIDDIIDALTDNETYTKSRIGSVFGYPSGKIIDVLEVLFPKYLKKTGPKKIAAYGDKEANAAMKKDKSRIMDTAGIIKAKVEVLSGDEKYTPDTQTAKLEEDQERLTFEEQLKDMANLLKLTISGASNACFIAGRGGIGKTYTTEQILKEAGLKNKEDYWILSGTKATPAGAYRMLFRHQNDVVVFDDSDSIFKDQDGRNLLKTATDTKKKRQLQWTSAAGNVVDITKDEYEGMTPDEILDDAGLVPRFFDFTGKIVFISNLTLDQLDPDGALRTRGYIISIDPTDAEIYDFMDKIVGGMELEEGLSLTMEQRKHVVTLLRKGKSAQTANLRKLKRGLNMLAGARRAGLNMADAELERMIATYA